MKKNLRYFMTLLLMMVASVGWADEESVTFSEQGYTNQQEVKSYAGTNFSIAFDKGTNSNAPKYYTTGNAIRVYGGSYFTVSSSYTITAITVTFGSGDGSNAITTDVGNYENGSWTGSDNSVTFTIGGTSGHRRIAGIEVTYTVGGLKTATVNIGSSMIKVGETTTVTTDGPDLTLDSSNSSIASVSGTTVTGVATGTATITATWSENSEYSGGTKELAVTVLPAGGTVDAPYTVEQAFQLIDLLGDKTSDNVYVAGKISSISEVSTSNGNATYFISDDGTTESNQLEIYRGKYLENENFTASDQIHEGDQVVVYGPLKNYNGTYEFTNGNYIYSIESASKPSAELSYATATVTKNEGDANFTNELTNPHSVSVTYSSSEKSVATVDANTGEVTIVGAGTTTISARFAGDNNYNEGSASYTLIVEEVLANAVTWNLSIDETATATASELSWTSEQATMVAAKGGATTPTNNYYPGTPDQSYTSTRFYKNSTLTIAPQEGYKLTSIVFTATTEGYATALANSTWENATASANGTTVTITPTDGTQAVVATIGATTGHSKVVVLYETVAVEKYYLVGSFNMEEDGTTWKTNDDTYKFTNNTVTASMTQGTTFKVIKNVDGEISWYGAAADGDAYWVNEENATNIALVNGKDFYMTADGSYTFTLDPDAMTLTVTGWPETEYNLLGSFNEWTASDDNKLTKGENGIYTITATVEAGATFKIKDSKGTWYGAEADGDFWLTIDNHTNIATKTDNGSNFYLENAGTYTFTFNTNDKTLTVDGTAFIGTVTEGCGIYQKVTSAEELEAGKRYLIVYENDEAKAYGGIAENTSYGSAVDATISGDLIDASVSTKVRPVALFASGTNWFIKDGDSFFSWTSGNSLALSDELNNSSTWTIAYSDGTCTITNVGTSERKLKYNSSSPRFACYTSAQTDVVLYKELTEAPSVTLSPTKEYTTLTSAYPLDFSAVDGLAAYIVKEEDVTSSNVKLTQVSKVPANTGLVIQKTGTEASYSVPVLTGDPDDVSENKMVGSATETTDIAENAGYILKDGKFSPSLAGTLAAGKAYLAVPVPAGEAKDLAIVFGEGTGINNVNVNENESGKIFNLAGQQMKSAVKGVYIKNGKKYIK